MPRLLGQKIRFLRRARHITQADLAQKVGLASQSHIANVEAGKDTVSLNLVMRVARLLETSTDYLLRDSVPIESLVQRIQATELDDATPFGARLRNLRLQHQLSQRDLANRLGLASRAYIAELEAERGKMPSLELVVRIADIFGITTDDLLHGTIPSAMDGTDVEQE